MGRVLGGFSTGMQMVLYPMYIAETNDPKYRGVVTGVSVTLMTFGIFLTHVVGTFWDWRSTALIMAVVPAVICVMIPFIPESPSWFIVKDRHDEALKVFTWLRGNGQVAKGEFEATWKNHEEKQNDLKENLTIWTKLSYIIKKPEYFKPTMILFCCFFWMQFSGLFIVIFYNVRVVRETLDPEISQYLIMNVFDVVRLIMTIIACCLLRVLRRRLQMMVSGFGTALSAFAFAVTSYVLEQYPSTTYNWIPVVALVSFVFFSTSGIAVLPWCLTGEILPLDLRSFAASLNVFVNCCFFFLSVKMAPAIFDGFGMRGAFVMYGSICLVATIILVCVMPETKNRTLVDIEKQFTHRTQKTKSVEQNLV